MFRSQYLIVIPMIRNICIKLYLTCREHKIKGFSNIPAENRLTGSLLLLQSSTLCEPDSESINQRIEFHPLLIRLNTHARMDRIHAGNKLGVFCLFLLNLLFSSGHPSQSTTHVSLWLVSPTPSDHRNGSIE